MSLLVFHLLDSVTYHSFLYIDIQNLNADENLSELFTAVKEGRLDTVKKAFAKRIDVNICDEVFDTDI